MEFTIYDLETAPPDSKEALRHAKETFGLIPNLEGILAQAPPVLKGSMALWDLFETSSFTPIERQVIYLSVNYFHECGYCMAAHSGLAKKIGMANEDIEALRVGQPLTDPKLQALRSFTVRMLEERGWVKNEEIEGFIAAGYTKQQVLEVILAIAVKVIHNYTNHIAQTPLDKAFRPYAWSKPDPNVARPGNFPLRSS
ncbi:Carboxymuconolactone decarboxylase (plasmid) [Gloeothece citriformis PCC 7424]|uniref:Carboxymuconolactone decarboxylase n=1 Tax=Gloeothece citriformis (strain PCC 7424) TaxID=65393 RepID=B7KLV5_GLOC7|nr:carboxymuconolactone decarboxylase family protein [Gloeothece citriformis]ACK73777.1 Carboxymuconolactone decarboxylase [Gloeothece citriformis PCC 7424]